jgi:outer membrane receptor for ferrienterochelin and colicins
MKSIVSILLIFICFHAASMAQRKTDANIVGHVVAADEHMPFVNIAVKGTTVGTATDQTGHYHLINAPVGKITLVATLLGYRTSEIVVVTEAGNTIEINFELEEDVHRLDEVVVTGSRDAVRRTESSIIVSSISPRLLEAAQAISLSEGMNFSTGLRTENNCQNCGITQVRMNGLDGSYSQVLINGRPVFTGLAAVYGLELIPAGMIEKVEVVRGSGSVLYGGNAIAGTINLKLKDPVLRTYEAGAGTALTGIGHQNTASDNNLHFNTSLVSDDYKSGLSVFGFHRNRKSFDANNDGFTELPMMTNTTLGARYNQRIGYKGKITTDVFHVNEYRRGGNKLDAPEHTADIAESLRHRIISVGVTYELFVRGNDILSVYTSGQTVDRESYFGAERSLKDYGRSNDFTHHSGIQYKLSIGRNSLIAGFDHNGSLLKDTRPGYPDFDNAAIENDTISFIHFTEDVVQANQQTATTGTFVQIEHWIGKLKLSAGARLDRYSIIDKQPGGDDLSQFVFTPRIAALFYLNENSQLRLSYGQGYRPPQIFNEDLHVEASGSRRVIYRNASGLQQEKSNSFLASFDFGKKLGRTNVSILTETFFTFLNNPFAYDISAQDAEGQVVYTRVNASGARVAGLNIEVNITPSAKVNLSGGFTLQQSLYDEAREFGEKRFLRTPDSYGFAAAEWKPIKKMGVSLTGIYTGNMLIPYYGQQLDDPEAGELRVSNPFFDAGLKVTYNIRTNGTTIQLFAGVKNIFDSFQSDFDKGINRDPGYIYGPASPRSLNFGFRLGNMLQ